MARQVGDKAAAKVEALGLAGITAIPESKRFYPSSSLAAPVVGFVGVDGNGLGGLESGHEKALAGKAGFVALERDPQGRDIPNGKRRGTAARRGSDLVTTLDQSLQYETEQALLAEVDRTSAQGGTAVIVDVKTGDILSMATVDGPTDDGSGNRVPAHAATNEDENRATNRRLRTRFHQQGHHDGGRARGRARSRPTPRSRSATRSTSATRTSTTRTSTRPRR